MLKNYLQIALRKAIKDKAYTIINILGLAIGLASFLFISRYINFERNIDHFHVNFSSIYRLHTDLQWNEVDESFPQTAPAAGTTILENFGEVDYVTRIRPYGNDRLVTIDEKVFREAEVLAVDSNFLKVFSFDIKEGNPELLFREPGHVVLSESHAQKYFGEENGINKSIDINGDSYQVSGIIEDAPANSHIQYSILVSNLSDEEIRYFEWSWVWCNLVTYVKLHPQADPTALEMKFPEMVKNHAGYAIERITGKSIDEFFNKGNHLGYLLEPLSEVYYSGYNPIGNSGSRTFIAIFSIVAITILLLAIINYANLTTARSMKRAKEIGLRKVVGSSKVQLHAQYLSESILYSLVSTVLAIFMYETINSLITTLVGSRWDLSLLSNLNYIWFILVIAIVVGLFAGIYPALYLSSINASRALKGLRLKGQNKSQLRNALVIFQFVISFCIIIFTLTVNRQISHLRNKDLGFDKENLLVINNISQLKSRNAFKEEINSNSAIISSTYSRNIPSGSGQGELFRRMHGTKEDFIMNLINADEDFISTFGLNMASGTGYTSEDLTSSSPKAVINRKAQRILEYEDAIGKTIMGLDDGRIIEISGIIEDFDYYLAQVDLRPIVIRPYNDNELENEIHFLTAKIASSDLQQTIADLEKIWNDQKTATPFQYHFYDQIFNDMYLKEIRLGNLLTLFSGLAISIALLGLVGLISFHTEQLTKSIGIRKVFGANSFNILSLITRDFLRLFIIAFAIAVPVANYAIKDWLDTFVFKIDIGVLLFVVPGLLVISVALFTIWTQSYKAVHKNPVDAIKNE